MNPRPRCAVIGAGLMGLWHARALRRAGGTLALVVDPDAGRALQLARRYRGCHTAPGVDALAAHRIAIAHICTPTPTHVPLITAALQANCHVLVEKPLAEDAGTTRGLLALASSRGLLLCPVHQVLFQHGVGLALQHLERVRVRHIDFTMCSAGAGRVEGADAALVAEILPHPLSLLVRVLGDRPDRDWQVATAGSGELRATLQSRDLTASILISTHGRPTLNGARLVGERGTIVLDFFHGFAVFHDPAVSRARKAAQPLVAAAQAAGTMLTNLARRAAKGQSAYPGLWELVAAFHAAARGAGPVPIPPDDAVRVAAMRDALLALQR